MSLHAIEEEVSEALREAGARAELEASFGPGDAYLQIRLEEIEESLIALARHLDEAFAEIRGEPRSSD